MGGRGAEATPRGPEAGGDGPGLDSPFLLPFFSSRCFTTAVRCDPRRPYDNRAVTSRLALSSAPPRRGGRAGRTDRQTGGELRLPGAGEPAAERRSAGLAAGPPAPPAAAAGGRALAVCKRKTTLPHYVAASGFAETLEGGESPGNKAINPKVSP